MVDFPDLGDWNGKRPAQAEDASLGIAEELAWTTIINLTAGRVVLAPTTVRPVSSPFGERSRWTKWYTGGAHLNGLGPLLSMDMQPGLLFIQGWGAGSAGHTTCELEAPCGGVTEVRIDGEVLAPSAWRLDDGNLLVRTDGHVWPTYQDPRLPAGAKGTFEVDYFQGFYPGRALTWAAAELAAEFYRAASGEKKSRLPSNVTTVVRQGVTFQLETPLFSKGKTGITEIDVVLQRYNPHGLTAPTVVASPDALRRNRRIGY